MSWYFQHLPGDDWDQDYTNERILLRTKVSPDPKFVKWMNPDIPRGQERDIVVNVGEGGGIFALDRATGQFLWANPFPYDDPNFLISNIDGKTGKTTINWDVVLKAPGEHHIICAYNTKSYWPMSYHPGKNSLYIPYVDDCLDMTRAAPAPAQADGQRGEAGQAPAAPRRARVEAAALRPMAASPSAGSASVVPDPIRKSSAGSPRSTCPPARFSGSTKAPLPATARHWRRRATSSSGAISIRNSGRSMPIREDSLGSDSWRADPEQHDHLSRERQAVCRGADRSGSGHAELCSPAPGPTASIPSATTRFTCSRCRTRRRLGSARLQSRRLKPLRYRIR